jgi:hypothetical protein
MELIPAIDLKEGRCVRLFQGDFAAETVYADDPEIIWIAIRRSAQRGSMSSTSTEPVTAPSRTATPS